jgi:hypothetical protein
MKRSEILAIIEKSPTDTTLKTIRSERDYRMPAGYISWKTLSCLSAFALSTCQKENALIDITAFIHSYYLALWYAKDAPIYCISETLLEALNNTDALHKPNVLAEWKPTLPYFLLAFPRGTLGSTSGKIDYIVVGCQDNSHPEWQSGQWRDIKIEEFKVKHDLHFQWATTDTEQTCWFGGTAIAADGSLIYQEKLSLGKNDFDEPDIEFNRKIRNLVINILLLLEHSPEIVEPISEAETKRKPKGFAVKPEKSDSNGTRYPRWLGKNYRYSQEKSTGSHASPRLHWRRGHWRSLEPSDNKPWKQHKRVWIEPVLVNG